MKTNRFVFLTLAMSLMLTIGCAINPLTNKNVGDKTNNSATESSDQKPTVKDKGEFKLLYNPPPGGNPENIGKIIYASDPGETGNADYDLYTINPDGSNKTRLTFNEKYTDHPAWSPEYSRIAYSTTVDFDDRIFIMTADGKEKKQLTFGEKGRDDKFPTWSPDGKYLAYISYQNKIPNLWVMDIYGENVKQLTFVKGEDTVLWPSWSPRGDVIAFSYNKAGKEIDFRLHTIKPDGTDERELLSSTDPDLGDHEPAWSPDGKIMYFISNRSSHLEIWKFDYDKLVTANYSQSADIGLQQISNLHAVNTTPDHRPRVSPDGSKIVFYGVGSDWNNIGTNLYTMNIDGSNLTNITKSIDGSEWPDW